MLDPQVELILDQIEAALDDGAPDNAIALAQAALGRASTVPDLYYLLGEAHRELGELEIAEESFRRAAQLDAHYTEAWSALALILFDLLQVDEALTTAHRAIRESIDNAEGYYARALIRERRGDYASAERDFRRAWRIDPDRFPLPVVLDDATVEAVVADAIRSLHPTLQAYLAQVPILLEEVPDDETCLQFDPPALPGELLGYFSGSSLAERSMSDAWSSVPATIVIFRRNIARIAQHREQVIEELKITLFHEVGHYLGLDEDDLEARGLD